MLLWRWLLRRCCLGLVGGKGNAKGKGLRLQGQEPNPQAVLCSKCSSLSLSLCHAAMDSLSVPVAFAWHQTL